MFLRRARPLINVTTTVRLARKTRTILNDVYLTVIDKRRYYRSGRENIRESYAPNTCAEGGVSLFRKYILNAEMFNTRLFDTQGSHHLHCAKRVKLAVGHLITECR